MDVSLHSKDRRSVLIGKPLDMYCTADDLWAEMRGSTK